MTKIAPEHLKGNAVVYIRQSSPYQVVNNLESKRLQYALVERGRQLGWTDVQVIDDDLGRSSTSGAARPGFEKLLEQVCKGNVGAVLSIEASRLARTGREWHTLLEFCGVVGTLIIDEERIYDPRHPDDRMVLGMIGTMSEMESSTFRQRSREARKQKARRGELFTTVAVGYLKTDDDRLEKDPNRRVQDAIAVVFRKFAELQSIRQVLLWIRDILVESRKVEIAGITPHPTEQWMKQMAHVTMKGCSALGNIRYLLDDCDTKYTASFLAIIESVHVKTLPLPARSPNLNAYSEWWVRSTKEECLSKLVLFGERSLRQAIRE
jgi:DNA invertase Pin-like site-specific DNA recombinase